MPGMCITTAEERQPMRTLKMVAGSECSPLQLRVAAHAARCTWERSAAA